MKRLAVFLSLQLAAVGCGKSFVEADAIHKDEVAKLEALKAQLQAKLNQAGDEMFNASQAKISEIKQLRTKLATEWASAHLFDEKAERNRFAVTLKAFDEKHGIKNGNTEAYDVPVDVGEERSRIIEVFEQGINATAERRAAEMEEYVDAQVGPIPSGVPDRMTGETRLREIEKEFEPLLAEQQKKVDEAAEAKEAAKR
jgi:hypothetical protein